MAGIIKMLIGMATGDLGTFADGALGAASDAVPGEVAEPIKNFMARLVGGIGVVAFSLGGLYAQGVWLSDITGLDSTIAGIVPWAVFLIGAAFVFVRRRSEPQRYSWRRFLGIYLACGGGAMFAALIVAILHWRFGVVFTIVMVLFYWLFARGDRVKERRDAIKQIVRGLEAGQVSREDAAQQLREAGLKEDKLDATLLDAERKHIVNRHIDGEIDAEQCKVLLAESGLSVWDVGDFFNHWTESLIMLRYIHKEITRPEARRLLTTVRGVTEAKANEWLDGFDRLIAIQESRKR